MRLAILFWFYKDPAVCLDRVKLLRKYNPEARIYGLYGGDLSEADRFKTLLTDHLDDFYVYEREETPDWKWLNGDLMLLDWYENRGTRLNWDSVIVVQWDLLVFASLESQFRGIKKGDIFLSGYRELDKRIEESWGWTRPNGRDRDNYDKFKRHLRNDCNYEGKIMCCKFVLEVLPRVFFEKYSQEKGKIYGMIEYRIPTYANMYGLNIFKKDLGDLWTRHGAKNTVTKFQPINTQATAISKKNITAELSKTSGRRVFHPYFNSWE